MDLDPIMLDTVENAEQNMVLPPAVSQCETTDK